MLTVGCFLLITLAWWQGIFVWELLHLFSSTRSSMLCELTSAVFEPWEHETSAHCSPADLEYHRYWRFTGIHYNDVIMSAITSQITSLTIVYSTICSGADQRKHQSSASLAFVQGIHRGPVNSPHKGPVTRKMFPFDDVIMHTVILDLLNVIILSAVLISNQPTTQSVFEVGKSQRDLFF